MIFKPAELTPFTAVKLQEILLEADCHRAYSQVVQGFAETGRLLTRHPDIRKVSLTGEVGTGKAVMSDAAQTLKSVTLELGGKSPLIIFGDAKLDKRRGRRTAGQFLFLGAGLLQRYACVRAPFDQSGLSRAAHQTRRRDANRRPMNPEIRWARWYPSSTCTRCFPTSIAAEGRARAS